MHIGVDMDEVLNNLTEKILLCYNEKYGDTLRVGDISDYDIHKYLKPECRHVFEEFADERFIESLDIAPGAVEVLSRLSKYHAIYFVTAGHPYTLRARDVWLAKHLPFYRSRQLVGCCNKQLLGLDVLIDDYEGNLIEGRYYGILFNKPWNRHVPTQIYNMKRIFHWNEIPAIISDLEKRQTRGI